MILSRVVPRCYGRETTIPNLEKCSLEEFKIVMQATPLKEGFRRFRAVHLITRGFEPADITSRYLTETLNIEVGYRTVIR